MTTYRVTHRTTYTYDDDVTTSFGRAHLLPRTQPDQRCADARVRLDPEPDELREHTDAFGNRSTYFCVRRPHRELTVLAQSTVTVDRAVVPPALRPWEQVRAAVPVEARPFVLPSPRLPVQVGVAAYAAPSFPPGRPLGEAAADLCRRIHDDFDYVSGSTTVRSTVTDLLTGGEGVCQDFAHLAVAGLRSRGLPARYVSGYLETLPPPGKPKLRGVDASHAWFSVWTGDGWLDLDPTNDRVVDEQFVVLAHGRDYGDVPPLKGVIFTDSAESVMAVSVDMERVEEG
ncbi:transglutaminase family protein [Pseudonocardia sp. WMMC193]|uniref:transglutaminase family protein n=1 Tax=Pseudonocardia sp. WMMC193 TaxID=2911965 RepID=UPI001F3DD622|nr:transglutaminase family protein [Pseudonocardia sp. WMMC193]MCF7553188.1 transglutaminase family protein [Pseudonocardia sp. WMMC193]